MKKAGFTLIELIVVITILAILGTIAFIGFKGYTSDARDSKVTTDIASLHNVLSILKAKEGVVPMPDEAKTVMAGTAKVTYEGEIGDVVRGRLNASSDAKTPTGDNYKYAVSENQKDFTLVGLLENEVAHLTTKVFAEGDTDIKYFKGGDVLTVFDSNNEFVNSDLLALKSGEEPYLGQEILATDSNGVVLKSCKQILDYKISDTDGNYKIAPKGTPVDAYCDMKNGGWTLLLTTDKDSVAFGNNNRNVSEWHKSSLLGTLPTTEAQVYTNVDYKGEAYSKMPTDDIKLCLADGSHCYTFEHNKGISLFDFFDKDITYKDAGYNIYKDKNFSYHYNEDRISKFEKTYGDFEVMRYQCGRLGINNIYDGRPTIFNGAIGFLTDNDGGCASTFDGEGTGHYDNGALGVGVNSCDDNSSYEGSNETKCQSGGFTSVAGNQYNLRNASGREVRGPWVVWGK